MPGYNTPKEMNHPSGSKVLLAFSTEDEQRMLREFAHYRLEQAEAHQAAIEGREIRKLPHQVDADDLSETRRGPGRPRNQEA